MFYYLEYPDGRRISITKRQYDYFAKSSNNGGHPNFTLIESNVQLLSSPLEVDKEFA